MRIKVPAAVATHLTGRLWLALSQVVTMALLTHYMTPKEQGFYYTFFSFQALENLFELGFRLVILHFATHEAAHLTWTPGLRLEGPEIYRQRLGHLVRYVFRFYSALALGYGTILLFVGWWFFQSDPQSVAVPWQWPWILMVIGAASMLLTAPVNLLLEGCGRVDETYRLRLTMGILGALAGWAVLLAHGKLFAAGAYVLCGAVPASIYIVYRYSGAFRDLAKLPPPPDAKEFVGTFWRFQNRVAASSAAKYLGVPLFAPVAFRMISAVAAGQIGMAVEMSQLILTGGSAWIITQAMPMGSLVAKRQYDVLDRRLRSVLVKSLLTSAFLAVLAIILLKLLTVLPVPGFLAAIARRISSIPDLIVLAVATLFQVPILAYTYYSRAFKQEPFVVLNTVVGIATVGLIVAGARFLGTMGIVLGYLIVSMFTVWWSGAILKRARGKWIESEPLPEPASP